MSRYYRSFLEESGSIYTARTTAFASATGITDTTILNALNTFDLGLISNNLDTKVLTLHPIVGGTNATHKYNFMNPSLYQFTIYGGVTSSSTGIVSNGTNGYVDTGIIPSSLFTLGNSMIHTYIRTNNTTSGFDIGVANTGNNAFTFGANFTSSTYYSANSTQIATSLIANTSGFFSVGSDYVSGSSYNVKLYRNATSIANNTVNPCVLNTSSIYLFSMNLGGAYSYSNRECCFTATTKNLSPTDVSTFYSLVNTLQTLLMRNV